MKGGYHTEGPGLPDHLRKAMALSIPMERGVESINAAMATGIILYMWKRQLSERMKAVID